LGSQHSQAYRLLSHAIHNRKGLFVLTGAAGTGKTALLRAVAAMSPSVQFGILETPWSNTSSDFLLMVLEAFGVTQSGSTKAQLALRLRSRVLELHHQGKMPTLMVDEAHTLPVEALEEIRLLMNFESFGERLLTIILAGQAQLSRLLNQDCLCNLKQRVEIRLDLQPVDPPEVEGYLKHRWYRAGGTGPFPFTHEVISAIAIASHGLPGLINSISENALLAAQERRHSNVGIHHIRKVLRDLDLPAPKMLPVSVSDPGTAIVHVGRDTQQCVRVPKPVLAMRPMKQERLRAVWPAFPIRLAARLGLGTIQWRRKEVG